ncbi:MAG: GTPase KRas precursor [Candidatus Heimdallarchaeota archaeon LC_3]|nr:MAG: GTPase KRas precursor [Candidatus Heimdallarchaeota archaeon LC_3]
MTNHNNDNDQVGIVSQVIKMVILGDGAVGKTTLIKAIENSVTSFGKNSQASDKTERTIFIDFHVVPSTSESPVIYSIWDLQGQRQVACHPIELTPHSILGGASIVVFAFAMNDTQSFENLFSSDGWYDITHEKIERENIPIIFVGNKCDMNQVVIPEAAEKICKRHPTFKSFIMTSAITGEGIEELISEMNKYVSSLYNYQTIGSERIFHEVTKSQSKILDK